MILILDYGSQYTQLIAKRLRAGGFAAEVVPGKFRLEDVLAKKPTGVILSGSPASVDNHDLEEMLAPDDRLLSAGLPLLGLCFGYQYIAKRLGGELAQATHREYGAAEIQRTADGAVDPLTKKLSERSRVWMSHGDSVTKLPPSAKLLLQSGGKPAAFSIPGKKIWGLQFHPEVFHTEEGNRLLDAFAKDICGLDATWTVKQALDETRERLRKELKGVDVVPCAVSGGVDSTVLAVLLAQVTRVRAIYVDHGFQRDYDLADLKRIFAQHPTIELQVVNARDAFWAELKGVSDPEKKRKTIGKLFIDTFADYVGHEHFTHLAQGTIYSDVIESAANHLAKADTIKSHHNVGGLPTNLKVSLVEPLRYFFKDEVREIGKLLGIDDEFLQRHPFPGPGLSIRVVGELQPERVEIVRKADAIFIEELRKRKLYDKTWQAFVVLLPVKTVGVMGDSRSYESVLAIRAVSSLEAMTAEASDLPFQDLKQIASRIVNEVRGINRVVFDLTSKPPGTIEWE